MAIRQSSFSWPIIDWTLGKEDPGPLPPLSGSDTYRHLEIDNGYENVQRAVELHRIDAVTDVGFDKVWTCGIVGVHISFVQLEINLKTCLIIQLNANKIKLKCQQN